MEVIKERVIVVLVHGHGDDGLIEQMILQVFSNLNDYILYDFQVFPMKISVSPCS